MSHGAKDLFDTDKPGGLHRRVYRSLAHAIVSGRFEKGTKLPSEPELATTFAVSRPVVRQALEILRHDGLIQSQRGSGSYVKGGDQPELVPSPLSLTQMQLLLDDLEFRLVVEPEAAFYAAQRHSPPDIERMDAALHKFEDAHSTGAITHHFDYLFHEAIALASMNGRFVDAVRSLEYRPDDARVHMRHLLHFLPSQRGAAVLREHGDVLALIRGRDADGAKQAMGRHIEAARQRLTAHIAAAGG